MSGGIRSHAIGPSACARHQPTRLLQGAGTAAAAAFAAEFLPNNGRKALAAGPSQGGRIRDIKHVVILVRENRSFDHYFGTLPNVRGFSEPKTVTLSSGKRGQHGDRPGKFKSFHPERSRVPPSRPCDSPAVG